MGNLVKAGESGGESALEGSGPCCQVLLSEVVKRINHWVWQDGGWNGAQWNGEDHSPAGVC